MKHASHDWIGPVRDWVPPALTHTKVFGHEVWQWVGVIAIAVLAYPLARFGGFVGVRIGLFFAKRTAPPFDDVLILAGRRPLRLVLGALFFREGAEALELSPGLTKLVHHVSFTLLLTAFAWFVLKTLHVAGDWAEQRAAGAKADEIKSRAFRTQMLLLRRIAAAAIITLTIAMVLLQFELVRSVGLSLLASAGIAGIVLGLAAQKTIGAMIAGVQLSITQPIRIGDTVLVEKEWGEIEEINLTYVVVRLWDGRRQIVPISRFLEQPFENWTMPDSQLTGAVHLPVDFMAPLEKLRPELARICAASQDWDGRVCDLRITDATENTMTLRATASAASPSAASSLRLDVREGLIAYLRTLDEGAYLPRRRLADSP